jgi:hypothetical protein
MHAGQEIVRFLKRRFWGVRPGRLRMAEPWIASHATPLDSQLGLDTSSLGRYVVVSTGG